MRIYFINLFIVISTFFALAQRVEMNVSQVGGLDTSGFCYFEINDNNILMINLE